MDSGERTVVDVWERRRSAVGIEPDARRVGPRSIDQSIPSPQMVCRSITPPLTLTTPVTGLLQPTTAIRSGNG